MKKAVLSLLALALLITVACVGSDKPMADKAMADKAMADKAMADKAMADKAQMLEGEYKWTRMDEPGAIEAVFTPTGEDSWDVSFHFTFEDKPHIYKGTAEGSLTDGALSGTVVSDGDQEATFTFEGKTVEGTFEGKHAVKRDEGDEDTGTIKLSHKS